MKKVWPYSVLIVALLVAAAVAWWQGLAPHSNVVPTLRVFAYDSFTSPFGPGPEIKRIFEEQCDCVIEYLDVGDAGLLVQRLKLKPSEPADAVIGLDQLQVQSALKSLKWRTLAKPTGDFYEVIQSYESLPFVAFDWAPMTFIYRRGEVPEISDLDGLLKLSKGQLISLQDPRTSTPGLQFLNWLAQAKGSEWPQFLSSLKPRIQGFSGSWSTSYGLFKAGQVNLTFSYLTSLIYHWREEKDFRYQAMSLKDGHPVQVEFAGVPSLCRQCELAEKFVLFLQTPEAQKVIMNKNYMLPVRRGLTEGTPFSKLPSLRLLPSAGLSNAELVEQWEKIWLR